MIPAALGDFVWIDTNRNGVQEPNEPGINGARVRLYTVDDSGKVSDTPLMETVTATKDGQAGYYLFDGLTKGRYVWNLISPLCAMMWGCINTALPRRTKERGISICGRLGR